MSKIDQDALAVLKEVMEEEFAPLLALYIQDSDARFETLKVHVNNADCDAIRDVVHSFKGASSNVCAAQLTQYAQLIEDTAKANQFDGLANAIDALFMEYQAVRAELKQEIKKPT